MERPLSPPTTHSTSSPRTSPRGRVRKWRICSEADSTNTRAGPKGRGRLPVVPSPPAKMAAGRRNLPPGSHAPASPPLPGSSDADSRRGLWARGPLRRINGPPCLFKSLRWGVGGFTRRRGFPARLNAAPLIGDKLHASVQPSADGAVPEGTASRCSARKPEIPASTSAHEGTTHVSIQRPSSPRPPPAQTTRLDARRRGDVTARGRGPAHVKDG